METPQQLTKNEYIKNNDLVFVVDSTGSMSEYLGSLVDSLNQILQILQVTRSIRRVKIITYKDYCDNKVITSSDWSSKIRDLIPFVKLLNADGGGDTPEAAKTAAHELLDCVDTNANTLVIWYTDAPPHHSSTNGSNYGEEEKKLKSVNKSTDWVKNLSTNVFKKYYCVSHH